MSGLSNCGYTAAEREPLRARWAPALNEHHLFHLVDDAAAFVKDCDQRVLEHAPFFVIGLWRVA